ncbi:DUF4170 domain-containing protein [Roseibium limicola]|uniref:DUF4170 domain-containing protein n=1 Tax=Roseibium limicola TaxID=2816037 RepID=A0A939J910_9HYPH|nr:DUF4170 domain-containing protein [Roseibium limicola]MBO0345876.1 DUF4170 domain-containing protein [Roseibium limicola]
MSDAQPLYLVFGGELESPEGMTFRDVQAMDVVGMFQSHDDAYAAWKAKAQSTVDNAHMRYFLVNLESLLTQPTDA